MDFVPEAIRDFLTAGVTSGIGSIIGTGIKMLRSPPRSIAKFIVEAFIRISVGTLIGGISIEWFNFGPWLASSLAAAGALCSDEIIRGIEWNAERLKKLKVPLPGILEEEKKDETQ